MSEQMQRKMRQLGKGNIARVKVGSIEFSVENNGRGLEAKRWDVKIRFSQLPKIQDSAWGFYQYFK